MKLTRAGLYALVATARLMDPKLGNRMVASHVLAGKDIPERFLLKVLKNLVTDRILVSVKGPNGGYRLARPAGEVTLLDVLQAVEGPLRGDLPDLQGAEEFTGKVLRRLHAAMKDVARAEVEALAKVPVTALAGK